MKIINVKGIAIVVGSLIVIQLAVGMIISPIISKVIIGAINKNVESKITIGSINAWPLTLSASMRDLKIFEPGNTSERMIEVKKASIRVSLWALLCKRVGISGITLVGADVTLKGEPDGSFNIQNIVKSEKSVTGTSSGRTGKGQDLFSCVYDILKNRPRGKKAEGGKAAAPTEKAEPHVQSKVVDLPKGRRVVFETKRRGYLFEVGSLSIKDARIKLEDAQGRSIVVDRANLGIKGLGMDPDKGAKIDRAGVKGRLTKDDKTVGEISISYVYAEKGNIGMTDIDISAGDIDLAAVSFIFQDSLPVEVQKGTITLRSKTEMRGDTLDSRNSLDLRGQQISPVGKSMSFSLVPMPVLCDAVNQVDPLKIDFTITGTVDNPRFEGFQDALMKIIEPYIGNIAEQQGKKLLEGFIKKDTGSAAGGGTESSAGEAVQAIKSLFNTKK